MTHKTESWLRIKSLGRKSAKHSIESLFQKDETRGTKYVQSISNLYFDYSKTLITDKVINEFSKLAKEISIQESLGSIFQGSLINNTEKRSVGHFWLRSKSLRPKALDASSEIDDVQSAFLDFAEKVRNQDIVGITGKAFTDVVNIGIGGSDLGPAMVYQALENQHDGKVRCHFISNIDESSMSLVLKNISAETTLFVVTSKTFTTLETMENAKYAKEWLTKNLSSSAVSTHFVAISADAPACKKFGVKESNIFAFKDYVGGRYSLLSSVGITIALGYGAETFKSLQKGASVIDQSLKQMDFTNNAIFIHACINIWNLNIMNYESVAVIPYSSSLARFPAFLQQLWMESNGKSVDKQGKKSKFRTSPVVFGEPGTNAQHSFFQMLHQGTDVIPVEFIVLKKSFGENEIFQDSLQANALAQSVVLAFGVSKKDLESQSVASDLISHKQMPGNRPSMTIILPQLNAESLGQLISFYEASVIIQGLIMNINSFDQWGVELGKKTANEVLLVIQGKEKSAFDSSTNNLINFLKS